MTDKTETDVAATVHTAASYSSGGANNGSDNRPVAAVTKRDFAAEARDVLRAAAGAIVADATLPDAMREAAGDVAMPRDLEGALGAMVSAILAAEGEAHRAGLEAKAWKAIADRYAAAETALRASLVAVMEDTGAPSIRTAHATAITSQGKASVVITDASLLPAEMTTQPHPVPDKAAIRAALEAGLDVPGASLGNVAPVLRIVTKKEAKA